MQCLNLITLKYKARFLSLNGKLQAGGGMCKMFSPFLQQSKKAKPYKWKSIPGDLDVPPRSVIIGGDDVLIK